MIESKKRKEETKTFELVGSIRKKIRQICNSKPDYVPDRGLCDRIYGLTHAARPAFLADPGAGIYSKRTGLAAFVLGVGAAQRKSSDDRDHDAALLSAGHGAGEDMGGLSL